MRALGYSFAEAALSLWRSRTSALFSIATIAGALVIFGAFLLVITNLEALVASWSSGSEISVYLEDDATEAQRSAIDQRVAASPIVASREYVSKAEGLARFKRQFEDLAAMASSFDDNPFPASFEVRVVPGAVDSDDLDRLAQQLALVPGVADVRYDRRWLQRIASALALVQVATVVFAVVLVIGAALTISNVVRLAFVARRDEIEIMQLVGAPLAFIRGPFLAEGIVQGGSGALLALAGLAAAHVVARQQYGELIAMATTEGGLRFLPLPLSLAILAGGMFVGCLGGLLATWGLGTRPAGERPAEAA